MWGDADSPLELDISSRFIEVFIGPLEKSSGLFVFV